MALRWIVEMCPRKFLGMANRVSIECVRSVLSSAGGTNSASSPASPAGRRDLQSPQVACPPSYRPLEGTGQQYIRSTVCTRRVLASQKEPSDAKGFPIGPYAADACWALHP